MSPRSDGPLDITTVFLYCAPTTADEASALMLRAVKAHLALDGVGLFDEDDQRTLDRPDGLAPEWKKKPVFLTDAQSAHAIVLHHFWQAGSPYHYLAIGPDSDVESSELEQEWRVLTTRAAKVLAALAPDLATGFAQRPEAEADPVHYGTLCSDASTRVLTPWTFIGSKRADDRTRQRIAALPGASVTSIADGVLINAVSVPGTAPDPQFLAALKAMGKIDYVDPLLEKSS